MRELWFALRAFVWGMLNPFANKEQRARKARKLSDEWFSKD